MEFCPCCNALMLRHIRSRQLFWLCQSCSFEMVIRSNKDSNAIGATRLDRIESGLPVAAKAEVKVATSVA